MKKRKLLTDIFTVVLMIAIVIVVLAFLNVFPGNDVSEKGSLNHTMMTFVGMPLAFISVALIDLVFPLIDNRERLASTGYKIKVIVKIILFLAAVVAGIMFYMMDAFPKLNDFVKLAIFCGLYFAEFMINLDPPLKKKAEQAALAEKQEEGDYEEFEDDEDED